jgi:hypothetical protein
MDTDATRIKAEWISIGGGKRDRRETRDSVSHGTVGHEAEWMFNLLRVMDLREKPCLCTYVGHGHSARKVWFSLQS